MSDIYVMPESRTFCGRFRCCREKNHAGSCEIDITYLDGGELEAIRKSGAHQVIPAEAVVAATKVLYADKMSNHSGDNAPQIFDACDAVVRKILDAAAPHITAKAVAYLDESVRMISSDPDVKDYERGFDDAIRGMSAKVKRLLNGEAQ